MQHYRIITADGRTLFAHSFGAAWDTLVDTQSQETGTIERLS